jgi:hypothetical protein
VTASAVNIGGDATVTVAARLLAEKYIRRARISALQPL